MGRRRTIALSLFVITLAIYAQAIGFGFVSFDDGHYVTRNVHVNAGLTGSGLAWALLEGNENWHPVTWVSHMLDVELFGLAPGGHHATSILLHALNTALLFVLLQSLTRAPWRSATVAALFALHPLHVESVAWVSERKDVLSTFLALLCTAAYVVYARLGGVARYLAVAGLFALALMAKPMVVTLPLLFLLLDHWPLERLRGKQVWLEKLPLLALSAVASTATFVAQQRFGAMGLSDTLPFADRVSNALVSYVAYLGKALWPASLAVHYPHPYVPGSGAEPYAEWQIAGAAFLLVVITAAALRSRPARVGWLWYLGMLFPVIGLVQVGTQAMADRYTYVPLVGIFVAVVWTAADTLERLFERREQGLRIAAAATAGVVLVACAAGTTWQLRHWRNSETLFARALTLHPRDPKIHVNLGFALQSQGRSDDAIAHYQSALATRPDYALAYANWGSVLAQRGEFDAAIERFEKAIAADPQFARAHANLGNALRVLGDLEGATPYLERALALRPRDANHHLDLGAVWLERGDADKALGYYRQALVLRPQSGRAHCEMASALRTVGPLDASIPHYRECVSRRPHYSDAWNNLAGILRATGRLDEAIETWRHALEIEPDDAQLHFNLANALGSRGRLDEAIVHFRRTLEIRPDHRAAAANLTRALQLQKS
jgi:tetratricopeptide (TPR) repeat protein